MTKFPPIVACLTWILILFAEPAKSESTQKPIAASATATQNPATKSIGDSPQEKSGVRLSKAAASPASANDKLHDVDFIVALVNSEPITRNEVQWRQKKNGSSWKLSGVAPLKDVQNFHDALEQLINERVIQQMARDEGVRVSDRQLDEALFAIARQHQLTSLTQLREKYETEGGNWSRYREEIRGQLMRLQLREREVDLRVQVSESEIDAALRDQAIGNQVEEEINLAQILVALPDNPQPVEVLQGFEKARRIALEAQKPGANFSKIAIETSDQSDVKTTGGVMGLRSTQRYPSLFVDAVKNLKVGETSQVIRSDAGFHILKLIDRQRSSALINVVQSRVRHILLPLTDQFDQAQAKAALRSYKAEIESGRASFATVAKEHSGDGSAAQGGDLGWVLPGVFVPEFEQVMNTLTIGKLSEPFMSRFGMHLVEVVDRKTVPLTIKDQRELVRNQLREKKATDSYALWTSEARARAFIEYKNAAE